MWRALLSDFVWGLSSAFTSGVNPFFGLAVIGVKEVRHNVCYFRMLLRKR